MNAVEVFSIVYCVLLFSCDKIMREKISQSSCVCILECSVISRALHHVPVCKKINTSCVPAFDLYPCCVRFFIDKIIDNYGTTRRMVQVI